MTIIKNSSGQTLTEYLILLVILAIASIGLTNTLGSRIRTKLKAASEKIDREVQIDGGI